MQATHWHSRMETEEPARTDAPARRDDAVATPSRVRAQPPEEFTGGEFAGASETSGGLAAVWSSMKHIAREAGLVRGTRTLLKVNQKDGFDCPGCAWPDPDGERSHAEFCENGAKAVAEEATTRRVGPDFFREWSVADLSQKSDFWLGKQGRLTQPVRAAPRRDALRRDQVGRGVPFNRRRAERLGLARRGGLLHFGAHVERGGLPLSTLRTAVRHEQPARLLEHVPRVFGARAHRDHRRRQGHRHPRRLRPRRPHLRHRAEPGDEPPAHAHDPARGEAARLQDRPRQPSARGGPRALQAPAAPRGPPRRRARS